MDELLNKISNLFLYYGVKKITMDDIANEFHISKKTLYLYFKNKNDMIFQITEYELKNECAKLKEFIRLNPNAIDQLRFMCIHIANNLRKLNPLLSYDMDHYYPEIWKRFINKRKEYLLILIKENFQTGIKQGVYRKNLNTDIIATFYVFLLDIKGFEMYKDETNSDFDKMFNTLFIYHIQGIANNKGIKYLENHPSLI